MDSRRARPTAQTLTNTATSTTPGNNCPSGSADPRCTASVAVLVALTATGALSARLGGSPALKAIIRVVTGGAVAMVVTFAIGQLVGQVGG